MIGIVVMIEVVIAEVVIEMAVEDLIVMNPQENEEVTTEVNIYIILSYLTYKDKMPSELTLIFSLIY